MPIEQPPNWAQILKDTGLTDAQIAAKIIESGVSVSRMQVGKMRRGIAVNPSYDLGKSILSLFGGDICLTGSKVLKGSATR